jgi:hypothetical protein
VAGDLKLIGELKSIARSVALKRVLMNAAVARERIRAPTTTPA